METEDFVECANVGGVVPGKVTRFTRVTKRFLDNGVEVEPFSCYKIEQRGNVVVLDLCEIETLTDFAHDVPFDDAACVSG